MSYDKRMPDGGLRREISLALHAAVASRLAGDPEILGRARARIERWLTNGGASAQLLLEWRAVLQRPTGEIRHLLTERSEHADWLRKASPFAGELPPREREHILRDVRARRGRTGWCLEIHDLLISKYVAGRDKDLRFTAAAARHALANRSTLLERLAVTEVSPDARDRLQRLMDRDHAKS